MCLALVTSRATTVSDQVDAAMSRVRYPSAQSLVGGERRPVGRTGIIHGGRANIVETYSLSVGVRNVRDPSARKPFLLSGSDCIFVPDHV